MIQLLRLLQIFGIVILVAPLIYTFGILFSLNEIGFLKAIPDLISVLLQASLSATLSLVLGVLSALSILTGARRNRWHLYFGLLPQFLPSLLMIFAYVKVFSFLKLFPQSYGHVVALHVLLNIGLVSFLVYSPLQQALQRKLHLYSSLKISRFKYLMLITRGELKVSFWYVWTLVFSYCLTSFSIPLILSGDNSATSLEYLIYHHGFIEGNWTVAAFWGLLQVLIVAYLFKVKPDLSFGKEKQFANIFKISSPFHIFSAIASAMLLVGLLILPVTQLDQALKNLSVGMAEILFRTGLLVSWSLLFYSLYFWTHVVLIWKKGPWAFYQRFWSLSPILLGIYMLSLSSKLNLGAPGRLILTALVLASFIFPITFKFWIWPKYAELQKIGVKLKILNVTKTKAINLVLISFFKNEFMWSLSFVMLFVVGDFAISSILLSDTPTLGLSIKNYIFKYQLAEAQILSLCLAIMAVIGMALMGGKNVFNRKL